jgi:NADP-dependent 3-hydroxy acid dehydrogenase YdfG
MKIVVITGGSSGIGAALGRELARRGGYALVLAARNTETLEAVARELGGDVRTVVADVTRRADVERIRDEALHAFGRVDVWINNAGRGITRPVLELTDEDVDAMMAVNVKSVLYGIQTIVPQFKQQGAGHIINVSSFLGRVPLATFRSVYSAAKAAMNSLTANLRVDLRRTHPDLKVSLVMPGIVTTDFARNAIGGLPPAPPPGGAMQPQTAEQVATVIADVIERPVAEVYTNPASPGLAKRYYEDIAAFEEAAH